LSTPVLHDPSNAAASEDRLMPAATYGLYFVGLFTALPIIVGAVMAYVMRGKSGPMAQSHYTYLIGTFWGAVLWSIVGVALIVIGVPLSFVLIGIPVVALGYAMFGIVWCWILLRLVVGSIHVLRGEAHPRPRAWLL
jgi:uncharacterized membrane protein